VLSLAIVEPTWTAILDDAAACECTRSYSLSVKGTLAIVLLAKQRGLIPSAAQIIRELFNAGFRLDDRLIREALTRSVSETWEP
jgi:predicted nucleic acid-binding protein